MLNQDVIKKLSENTSEGVLSLYLRIDPAHRPNQNTPRAWQIYVNNALKEISDIETDVDTDAIASHTHHFLEGYTPAGKSLVLFVDDSGVIGNFTVPVSIDNQHTFGTLDVVPLLWAIDEYERYLVVLVDSEQAQFMSAYLGRATNDDSMQIDFDEYDFGEKQFVHANQSGSGQQGSGGDQYDDMKQEHIRRFHSDVANEIQAMMDNMQSNRLILGGNEQAAHQVQDLLHDRLKAQVVGIVPMSMQANTTAVAEKIDSMALTYERAYEFELVDDVISLAKSGGRGALGAEDVLQTLENQQVELLILAYGTVDDALARQLTLQALENGADIELVRGSAAHSLADVSGIAARLYYAIPETQ